MEHKQIDNTTVWSLLKMHNHWIPKHVSNM